MGRPKYKHLVQNRTDLAKDGGGVIGYALAVPPFVDPYPPQNYEGEVIPPYAVMRVADNPTLYKNRLCWPVSRPDDISHQFQERGLHFINGPLPIPLNGYGLATNQLPAPCLCDLTARQSPYAGSTLPTFKGNAAANLIGVFFGYMSGSWALHPADDIISVNSNLANLITTFFSYTVLGQDPQPDPQNPGKLVYSQNLFWVGEGGKGFYQVNSVGSGSSM